MASIYTTTTGETITEGLQGGAESDQALAAALSLAKERGESVLLVDDDRREWIIQPDGSINEHDSAESSDQVRRHAGDSKRAPGWYPVINGVTYWGDGPHQTAHDALEAAQEDVD